MRKILIIDDDPAVLKVLKMRLEVENYKVVDVTNGADAHKAIQKDTFDLCVIDFQLGNENGIDLMVSLKQQNPDVSAIILTAYGTIQKAVEAGSVNKIVVPFDSWLCAHIFPPCALMIYFDIERPKPVPISVFKSLSICSNL